MIREATASDIRTPKLGIIAGAGALPALLVTACQAAGRSHFLLGISGFADDAGWPHAADSWIRLGEFGKAFTVLRDAGVQEVVMAGAVQRPALGELRPDLRTAAFVARIAGRALGDDGLLSAVIGEIEREGFRVVGVDGILGHLLAPEALWGRHKPDADAEQDVARGIEVAHAIGALDVGQAVVVQGGIVLGVEGAEGTDALIARCGVLRREGAGGVLVKAKKPQQERRADLPTIGETTVRNAAAAGLRGIAVEAANTLVIDRAAVISAADAAGMFVMGFAPKRGA